MTFENQNARGKIRLELENGVLLEVPLAVVTRAISERYVAGAGKSKTHWMFGSSQEDETIHLKVWRAHGRSSDEPCVACSIEAEIGTEDDPHPVPSRFHTCEGTPQVLFDLVEQAAAYDAGGPGAPSNPYASADAMADYLLGKYRAKRVRTYLAGVTRVDAPVGAWWRKVAAEVEQRLAASAASGEAEDSHDEDGDGDHDRQAGAGVSGED